MNFLIAIIVAIVVVLVFILLIQKYRSEGLANGSGSTTNSLGIAGSAAGVFANAGISGYVWDAYSGLGNNGDKVGLWNDDNSGPMNRIFIYNAKRQTIDSAFPGKSLTVDSNNYVTINDYNNGANQRFVYENGRFRQPSTNLYITYLPVSGTPRYLTMQSGGTGTQYWTITPRRLQSRIVGSAPAPTASSTPPPPSGPVVTLDCGKYGNSRSPDQSCPSGYSMWGGQCFINCPSGSTRTAPSTCDFGAIETRSVTCNIVMPLQMHGGCPELGYEWIRTTCGTCQRGGPVTNSSYSQTAQMTTSCRSGEDSWGGLCYSSACPSGTHRTTSCTCST